MPLFVRSRRISGHSRAQNRGVKKRNARCPAQDTLRAGKEQSQIRKAQFRAYSGMRFFIIGKEAERDSSVISVFGKMQTNETGVRVKSWFCPGLELETGVAGTGCDSGEGDATQHAPPQWQECATRTTPAARACARTRGVPASNRLQTMANIVFTFRISTHGSKEAQPLLASSRQFLACSPTYQFASG